MKEPEKSVQKNSNINRKDAHASGKHFKILHWHIIAMLLMLYDMAAVNASYFFALWMRHDFMYSAISPEYINAYIKFIPIYTAFCLIVFLALRLYRSIWRFASYNELIRVFAACAVTSVFHTVFITIFFRRMPISYYIVGSLLQFIAVLGIRFAYRFILLIKTRSKKERRSSDAYRVMLIGAGSAGQMIIRDLHSAKETADELVCCIIDDNKNKWGRYIEGVPVIGGREKITSGVKKYKIDKIYFAIPSASAHECGEILNICKETGCKLKRLPGIYQFANDDISVNALKEVNVIDLLGREPAKVNTNEIFTFLTGKVILVTGGGGSIGSELCRQIADHAPGLLLILDIYENNAHAIQLELQDSHPDLNLKVLIGSVRDSSRLNSIFSKYKPDVVFHAAAHKHVPLMEYSPCEAIKNNAIGTYKTAYAAMMNGCKRFVLISTDKAVNPTNIMGASKRLCEMIIQSFDHKIKEKRIQDLPILHIRKDSSDNYIHDTVDGEEYPHTEFVAVRFGNVLGSNGSVLPRFKEQIAHGGPVTVTHPEITRYFMTIPEAASLVLQAGTYAKGGEIFVLDMGEPVKIDTLARNLIKLSGFKPDIDIKIVYTGLRPGEKLYEEKLMAEEGLRTTPNHLIHIGKPIPFDTDHFLMQIEQIMEVAYHEHNDEICNLVAQIVPTYSVSGINNPIANNKTANKKKKKAVRA